MRWPDLIQANARRDRILGLPLVAENPDAHKAAYTFDAYELLLSLKAIVEDLGRQAEAPGLLDLTRRRLVTLRDAHQRHFTVMEELLRSLGHANVPFADPTRLLGQKRTTPALMKHYELLGRDWCWGGGEIDAAMEITRRVVGPTPPPAPRILALGAGACRYPYEVHRLLGAEYTLCVDINPLLLSCARRVIEGEPMSLVEFPVVPKDIEGFTTRADLRCESPDVTGFEFLVHDLDEWAFREKSFDLVITPWLVDVVPILPRRLFSLINSALADGGHWLNFGPLGFNRRMLAHYYSLEEVLALADEASFDVLSHEAARVPYLQHPASSHWRVEGVLTFLARKRGDAPVVSRQQTAASLTPEWVLDTSKPVHLPQNPAALRRGYEFSAGLLARMTPSSSIDSLARDVAPTSGLTEAQTKYLVTGMLLRMLETARQNPMK